MRQMQSDITPVQQKRMLDASGRLKKPSLWLQLIILATFLAEPLFIGSFRIMDVAAKIMVFSVLVASYDLLLGFTGIFSLAHAMFFGVGAYSMALIVHHSGGGAWYHLILAPVIAVALSASISLVIAFFSLRFKALFFVVMTLALAQFAEILSVQWHGLTMGEDGVSFDLPGWLNSGWDGQFLGIPFSGRMVTYYVILIAAVLLFIGLVRFVRSPAGRVLQSIRENEQRSTAIGFKTFNYQVLANVFGSSVAALCGVLYAMWVRFVDPESAMAMGIMLNILLMLVIGGMGSLYGAIAGSAFVLVAESWLADGLQAVKVLLPQSVFLDRLTDRWVLYFGILFILVVIFFPKGIVGTVKDAIRRRRQRQSRIKTAQEAQHLTQEEVLGNAG